MEQGSMEKSLSASLTQNKQLHNERNFTHDLDPLMHSTSQECPINKELSYRIAETSEFRPSNLELLAALQSNQTQQIGPSFSRAPLRGELLSQFHGANYEDLSAAYLHGNSHSHAQQLYNLPLSNLPREFCLPPSSSMLQGEHIGSFQTNLVPFGSSIVDSSIDASTQKTYAKTQAQQNAMMLESSLPLRPIRTQGILNTPSGFDVPSGSSSRAKEPTSSALKRKMIWQDEKTPSYRSWNHFGRGYQRYSSRSFDAIGGRYTLYDKRYEDIGLPVDPHLRIFNATNGNGNEESSTKKN